MAEIPDNNNNNDDRCHESRKIEQMRKDIHDVQIAIVKIESRLEHTVENKHAEALSVARAIDVKFKWISVATGTVAIIGVMSSLLIGFGN